MHGWRCTVFNWEVADTTFSAYNGLLLFATSIWGMGFTRARLQGATEVLQWTGICDGELDI